MKVRQAFVANSSSSSFLIGCNTVPTTIDTARKEFFSYGGEFVCDAVVQHMIENMKPYKLGLNFNLLLEMAKTKKWKDINNYNQNTTSVEVILLWLAQNFDYSEKYNKCDNYLIYNCPFTPFETWVSAEEDKLVKKLGVKARWDIPYKYREKIKNRWFDKKKVKEAFVQDVEWFCNDFSKYEILMYGEFSDDTNIGSEVEHGGHWEKTRAFRRFSHH